MATQKSTKVIPNGEAHGGRTSKQQVSRNVSSMIRNRQTYIHVAHHVSDIKMRNWKRATKRSAIKVAFVL